MTHLSTNDDDDNDVCAKIILPQKMALNQVLPQCSLHNLVVNM